MLDVHVQELGVVRCFEFLFLILRCPSNYQSLLPLFLNNLLNLLDAGVRFFDFLLLLVAQNSDSLDVFCGLHYFYGRVPFQLLQRGLKLPHGL